MDEKIEEINRILIQQSTSTFKNETSLFSSDLLFLSENERNFEYVECRLNNIIGKVDEIELTTFADGLCGFGWFLQHLINIDLLEKIEVEELLLQIDAIAYSTSLTSLQCNNHDFLHGPVGNGVYLVDRFKRNRSGDRYLSEILKSLRRMCKEDERGMFWEESSFSYQEKEKRSLEVDLSLSHGLASKIVFFADLYKLEIEKELSKEMLLRSTQFLLNNKISGSSISLFPSKINKSRIPNHSRLAWCYGDLGISMALWQAGNALQDSGVINEAIDICLRTTKRKTLEDTGVVDAGICHGTAGVAHIYNRMYWNTKMPVFKEAANYWIEETLKLGNEEGGLAGYKFYRGEKEHWQKDFGFLEGITGVGLVLKAHFKDIPPLWDRSLLLS